MPDSHLRPSGTFQALQQELSNVCPMTNQERIRCASLTYKCACLVTSLKLASPKLHDNTRNLLSQVTTVPSYLDKPGVQLNLSVFP